MKVKYCLFWEHEWHCHSYFSSTRYLELLFSFCHSCEVKEHRYLGYKRVRGPEMLGWNGWRPEPKSNRSSVEELLNLCCISYWEYLGFYGVPQCRLQCLFFFLPYLCDDDLPPDSKSFAVACVSLPAPLSISVIFYIYWLLSYPASI